MRRSVMLFLLTLFIGSVISGCGTVELEDRNFPIELAVQDTENFAQEFLDAESVGNRMIDYSHLKVVILSRTFVEDASAMQEFLALMEAKNEIPRNTYVVVAEDAGELMDMEQVEGESVGNYIEQMFENVSKVRKQAYPTIGMLYQEQENRRETLFIPCVKRDEDKLEVENYYVWKRGMPVGIADSETALLSFFIQNQMEEYRLVLADGDAVRLFDAHNVIAFEEKDDAKVVTVTLSCSGEVLNCNGRMSEEEQQLLERELGKYVMEITERARTGAAVDVSNSFRKLGTERDWYFYYRKQEEVYEQDVRLEYRMDIDWVNL